MDGDCGRNWKFEIMIAFNIWWEVKSIAVENMEKMGKVVKWKNQIKIERLPLIFNSNYLFVVKQN